MSMVRSMCIIVQKIDNKHFFLVMGGRGSWEPTKGPQVQTWNHAWALQRTQNRFWDWDLLECYPTLIPPSPQSWTITYTLEKVMYNVAPERFRQLCKTVSQLWVTTVLEEVPGSDCLNYAVGKTLLHSWSLPPTGEKKRYLVNVRIWKDQCNINSLKSEDLIPILFLQVALWP